MARDLREAEEWHAARSDSPEARLAVARAQLALGSPGLAADQLDAVLDDALDAVLDAGQCLVVAQGAHDGLARAVFPPHMRSDGDGFVAAATGEVEAPVDQVRMLAVVAVETAIRSTVGSLEG